MLIKKGQLSLASLSQKSISPIFPLGDSTEIIPTLPTRYFTKLDPAGGMYYTIPSHRFVNNWRIEFDALRENSNVGWRYAFDGVSEASRPYLALPAGSINWSLQGGTQISRSNFPAGILTTMIFSANSGGLEVGTIGSRFNGIDFWNGYLANIKIYDGDELVRHYPLDDPPESPVIRNSIGVDEVIFQYSPESPASSFTNNTFEDVGVVPPVANNTVIEPEGIYRVRGVIKVSEAVNMDLFTEYTGTNDELHPDGRWAKKYMFRNTLISGQVYVDYVFQQPKNSTFSMVTFRISHSANPNVDFDSLEASFVGSIVKTTDGIKKNIPAENVELFTDVGTEFQASSGKIIVKG